jgi:AcrR family transcriptional regulator
VTNEGKATARDRLLFAAAKLLDEARGKPVSTRAVCEVAGVQAPTLYHHFGNKQGLFDAVLEYGMGQYVTSARETSAPGGDLVSDLRRGWDSHVQYGLDHPAFYVLLYGQIAPGKPCAVTAVAEAMLLELLTGLAAEGRLRVPPAEAAAQIVAANVGITLTLIAQPAGRADLGLSHRLRDNIVNGLIRPASTDEASSVAETASAFIDAVDADPAHGGLTAGERNLLDEWLHRMRADVDA